MPIIEDNECNEKTMYAKVRENESNSLRKQIMNEIMTIKQVAEYLKVSPRSIYKLVKDGAIPTFRIMNMWRFERSKIDQWINEKNGINNSVTVHLTAEHAKTSS